jgi:hypothetical protein
VVSNEILRRTVDHPDLQLEVCNELEAWFTEKKRPTPFHNVSSLMHLAAAIAQQTMSMPSIHWVDKPACTIMIYQGHRIRLQDICAALSDLHAAAVEAWETKVLMGLRLRAEYGEIADDMTNKAVGYSCFMDPRNSCFERKDVLLSAILGDSALRKKFLRVNANDEAVWNRPLLMDWLRQYAAFEELQLAASETMAGGPGRMTELSSMCVQNTHYRTTRSFYMMGRYPTILVTYHKSGGILGHDRTIPHALDAITGDLTIQDHAIARPFARMAVGILFPDDASIRRLYDNLLFVNLLREFTTDDVSKTMGSFFQTRTGMPITVRPFRQISTAFKRQRCKDAMELLQEDGEGLEMVDALQMGHNRFTDQMRYAVSKDALASAPPEEVLPLYLEASTDWQVETGVVPGGWLPVTACCGAEADSLLTL